MDRTAGARHYDGLERLVAVTTTNPESFTLDGASNITARTGPSATYTIDGENRPTSDGTNTLVWSDADRLTVRGADTFGYDPLDRLTSSTVAGTARSYAYNGDGLLQSRTTGASTVDFLWDPATSPSRLLVSGSDLIVYGLGPLYSVNGTTMTTYARDGQKSVRAELQGSTVIGSWRYRAYGEVAQSFGSSTPSILGYADQLLDASGLYYMRARWYDSVNTRFLMRDPLSSEPSQPRVLNAFEYAGLNPITMTDPSGLFFTTGDESASVDAPGDPCSEGKACGGPAGPGGAGAGGSRGGAAGVAAGAGSVIASYVAQEAAARPTIVYQAFDRLGRVVYVGITYADRFEQRVQEHGERFADVVEIDLEQLTRAEARGVEQVLIENVPNLQNKINSIALLSKDYERLTDIGYRVLSNAGWQFR